MAKQSLDDRVERLERIVEGPGGVIERLDVLHTEVRGLRVEFLQFRDEARAEFSDMRHEITGLATRQEMLATRQEMAGLRRDVDHIRTNLMDTRTEMRVLHEDVIARLSLLQEGMNAQRTRPQGREGL